MPLLQQVRVNVWAENIFCSLRRVDGRFFRHVAENARLLWGSLPARQFRLDENQLPDQDSPCTLLLSIVLSAEILRPTYAFPYRSNRGVTLWPRTDRGILSATFDTMFHSCRAC